MSRFHFFRFVRALAPDRSETFSLFWLREFGIRRFILDTPDVLRELFRATRDNPAPDRNRFVH